MTAARTLLAVTWLVLASRGSALQAQQPSFLVFYSDDHACNAIGAYGAAHAPTPNIDRLAAEGLRFANSFVGNSICAPARATLLTGVHSHVHGVIDNGQTFDGSQPTFPKLLQQVGYQTALIGKWHLESEPTGFDHWDVLIGQGTYYNPSFESAAGTSRVEGYTSEIIIEKALAWLREERDPERPFLLLVQHKAPHRGWSPGPRQLELLEDEILPEPPTLFDDYAGRATPAAEQRMTIAEHLTPLDLKLRAPGNLTEEQQRLWDDAYGPRNAAFEAAELTDRDLVRWRFQRYLKDYLRCVAGVDEGVGAVLAELEELDLAQETLVVYSSDQGFYLGEHGWYDKRWMYEESLRTPLIVRWPGVTSPGSVDEHLVQNIDLAPTFLELAGLAPHPRMQGESLAALVRGEPSILWREAIYYHYYEYPRPHHVAPHYGVRTDLHKLIHYYERGEWELFDLARDPRELASRWGDEEYAAQAEALRDGLARLQVRYGDLAPAAAWPELSAARGRMWGQERATELALAVEAPAGRIEERFDPAAKPFCVSVRLEPTGSDGVLVAQGGVEQGWVLYVKDGRAHFSVRSDGGVSTVSGGSVAAGEALHLAGMLDGGGILRLFADGSEIGRREGRFLTAPPIEALEAGADSGTAVDPAAPGGSAGTLRDLHIWIGALTAQDLLDWLGQER